MSALDLKARIENRLDERAYFAAFSGEPVYGEAETEPEPEVVSMFAGLPTTTVDAMARRVIAILEAEGYIRKQVRPTTAALTQAAASVPRAVPTPAPRPIEDTPQSMIEELAGERLYLRSILYKPTSHLTARWEGIVDDGADGKYPRVSVWIYVDGKKKLTDAGYSESLFTRDPIKRTLLQEAIPVTLRWDNYGAKIDQVLQHGIEVRRRA